MTTHANITDAIRSLSTVITTPGNISIIIIIITTIT